MYNDEFSILDQEASTCQSDSTHELNNLKDALSERINIISKLSKQKQFFTNPTLKETIREIKIQKLIWKIFGFSDFSKYEWGIITDPQEIAQNLKEVELFMFDDPEIAQVLSELHCSPNDDPNVSFNQSEDLAESFDYPKIKTKYDEFDTDAVFSDKHKNNINEHLLNSL